MYKVLHFIKRKPHLTHEQFKTHFERSHAAMALKFCGHLFLEYRRNYVGQVWTGGDSRDENSGFGLREWDWDLISEWILPSEEAYQEIIRIMLTPGIDDLFHADEDRFIDRTATVSVPCDVCRCRHQLQSKRHRLRHANRPTPLGLMDALLVRRATPADAPGLALAGAATFLETYAHMIPGADILAHAATKHSEAFYTRCLNDPQQRIWIAQTVTEAIIGYLVLAPATLPLESPSPDDREIVRIYVLSRFHKTGAGHRLMQEALTEATRSGAHRLVLGVNNGNEKALAFYARQGFARIGTRTFTVGKAVFDDFVLGKNVLF